MLHRDKKSNVVFHGEEKKDLTAIAVCRVPLDLGFHGARTKHFIWASRGMSAGQMAEFSNDFAKHFRLI